MVCHLSFADVVSLEAAYRAALEKNEDVGNQEENVRQAEEKYSQAKGALFPKISFNALILRQPSPASVSDFSPAKQQTYQLTGDQPLFRGFREWAALRQQKQTAEATQYSRDEVLRQLYITVEQAFYQVLMAEKDYQDLKREIDVNEKRYQDLVHFRSIGRSRESDLLAQRSNIALLEAQHEAAKTTIQNSRAAFAFLTGLDSGSLLTESEAIPNRLEGLEVFLAKVNQRPDLASLTKTDDAAREGISIAKGAHLPSVDLLADYYFQRPGYLQNVNWDVQLSLTFPIFQGGIIQSQVRQAVSIQKQSDLALAKARRNAYNQIQVDYQTTQGDLIQIEMQSKAADLAEKNYQAEIRDYRRGIVTNIEVLQVLTTAQETQRSVDRVIYQQKIDYLKLLADVGERPGIKPSTDFPSPQIKTDQK